MWSQEQLLRDYYQGAVKSSGNLDNAFTDTKLIDGQLSQAPVSSNLAQLSFSTRNYDHEAVESLEIDITPTKLDNQNDDIFDMSPSSAGKIASAALSVGVVWWAGRSAGLLTALMASVPAWRTVDPLPILARDRRRNQDKMKDLFDESDQSLAPDQPGGAKLPPSSLLVEVDQ